MKPIAKHPQEYLVLHIAKAKQELIQEVEALRQELAEVKRANEASSDAFNTFLVSYHAPKTQVTPDITPEPQAITTAEVPQQVTQASSETLHIFEQVSLDSLAEQGRYVLSQGAVDWSNEPLWLTVECFSKTNDRRILQRLFSPSTQCLHIRCFYNGAWQAWKPLTTKEISDASSTD